VGGDQQNAAILQGNAEGKGNRSAERPAEGIDDRVSGEENPGCRHSLASQCLCRTHRGGKMVCAQDACHAAVHLLRKRTSQIAGTEPCFDVTDGDLPVKGRQRRCQHRGRISLHQQDIRFF